jgi:hypothetical protein
MKLASNLVDSSDSRMIEIRRSLRELEKQRNKQQPAPTTKKDA